MKNAYETRGEDTIIYVQHKKEVIEALIDTEDLHKLMSMNVTWCAWKPDRLKGKCYIKTNVRHESGKRTSVYLHKVILDVNDGLFVDHINRNPLNNKKSNLREATRSLNSINRDPSQKQYVGITWDERCKKWRASMEVNGVQKTIGRYDGKDEARDARNRAIDKISS